MSKVDTIEPAAYLDVPAGADRLERLGARVFDSMRRKAMKTKKLSPAAAKHFRIFGNGCRHTVTDGTAPVRRGHN